MIFVTPAGGASYISMPFEGSCSDRQIFRECDVIDQFDEGDILLVDRGIGVDDLLAGRGAKVKMPPSGPGSLEAMSKEDELYTKVIARARVIV